MNLSSMQSSSSSRRVWATRRTPSKVDRLGLSRDEKNFQKIDCHVQPHRSICAYVVRLRAVHLSRRTSFRAGLHSRLEGLRTSDGSSGRSVSARGPGPGRLSSFLGRAHEEERTLLLGQSDAIGRRSRAARKYGTGGRIPRRAYLWTASHIVHGVDGQRLLGDRSND